MGSSIPAAATTVPPPAPGPTAALPHVGGSRRLPFSWALAALVAAGLLVRVAVLASPLGELDADEAVVGLMARHIAFLGERPIVYYGQHYLGSLEAFAAAPLFLALGPSVAALKAVPIAFSLGFLVLTALTARRLFGDGPALLTAAYLALPPAMWAVWSTKARGGYAEVLCLGAALLLCTLWLAERRRPPWGALLWGVLAGLAAWTHLLAVMYVAPAALYLFACRRATLGRGEVLLGVAGGLLGAAPLLLYNATQGFPTLQALLAPGDLPLDERAQVFRFFRVGIPVLAGLGQPTTSARMFDRDWLHRPAGFWPLALLLLLCLGVALALHLGALRRLLGRARPSPSATGPALLLLLAAVVPPIVALTKFGFFVSEPRYALPLYSAFPLVAAALWRLPRLVRTLAACAVLLLNAASIATTDVRLWWPEEALSSTAASRADLARWLVAQDRHQVYTDYWVAYPLMFETGETIHASVVSGGYNRYLPPADNVARTPGAAWVLIPSSQAEEDFAIRLILIGGRAERQVVSTYHVYTDIDPPDAARPLR